MKEVLLFGLFALFYALHAAYPKPAKNAQLTLKIDNLRRGSYSVLLFNLMGRKVTQFEIEVLNDDVPKTLQLPASIRPGTYNLLITDGNLRLNKTLTV